MIQKLPVAQTFLSVHFSTGCERKVRQRRTFRDHGPQIQALAGLSFKLLFPQRSTRLWPPLIREEAEEISCDSFAGEIQAAWFICGMQNEKLVTSTTGTDIRSMLERPPGQGARTIGEARS